MSHISAVCPKPKIELKLVNINMTIDGQELITSNGSWSFPILAFRFRAFNSETNTTDYSALPPFPPRSLLHFSFSSIGFRCVPMKAHRWKRKCSSTHPLALLKSCQLRCGRRKRWNGRSGQMPMSAGRREWVTSNHFHSPWIWAARFTLQHTFTCLSPFPLSLFSNRWFWSQYWFRLCFYMNKKMGRIFMSTVIVEK